MSVIEAPFGFFEVGKEGIGPDTAESCQAGFGVTPEGLNSIDVPASPGEFIGTVVNAIMPVAFENQAVVSAPSIGEDDALVDRKDMSLNHLDVFGFRIIGEGGTNDSAASFEKPDNWNLPRRTTPANAANPSWSEVAFIHFNTTGKRRCLGIGQFNNPPAEQAVDAVSRVLVDLGQTTRFERFHISAKQRQNCSKFTLRNARMLEILVFHCLSSYYDSSRTVI